MAAVVERRSLLLLLVEDSDERVGHRFTNPCVVVKQSRKLWSARLEVCQAFLTAPNVDHAVPAE